MSGSEGWSKSHTKGPETRKRIECLPRCRLSSRATRKITRALKISHSAPAIFVLGRKRPERGIKAARGVQTRQQPWLTIENTRRVRKRNSFPYKSNSLAGQRSGCWKKVSPVLSLSPFLSFSLSLCPAQPPIIRFKQTYKGGRNPGRIAGWLISLAFLGAQAFETVSTTRELDKMADADTEQRRH